MISVGTCLSARLLLLLVAFWHSSFNGHHSNFNGNTQPKHVQKAILNLQAKPDFSKHS